MAHPSQLGGHQPGQSIMQPRTALQGDDGKLYCSTCRVKNLTTGALAPRPLVPFGNAFTDEEGYRVQKWHCTACGCETAARQSDDHTCESCGHVNRVWRRGRPVRRAPAQGTGTASIKFACPPPCGTHLEAPRSDMGTEQQCPRCRRTLTVPGMQRRYSPDEPMPAPESGPGARQSGAYGPR